MSNSSTTFGLLLQLVEDVDALDLEQLVRRARIAAEQALGRRELGPFAARHETPQAGAASRGDLLVTHAGPVLAPADAVLGETLRAEADDRRVFLVDLVFAAVAHEAEHRRHRVLAVGIAARALAVAVDVAAEVAGDVAVLREPAVDQRSGLVVLRRDDGRVAGRQAVVELGHRDGPDDAALEQRHQAHRLRHLALGVDDRVAIGDDLDRRQHGHRMRQVRPDVLQQPGAERRLERRDVGVDRAIQELRRGAAEIEHHPVALDRDGERDLLHGALAQRRVHELQHPGGAVRQFADATAHLRLDVLEVDAQRADQRVPAELVEDRDHAVAQPHDRVQLHLHVLELQLGVAHRVLQERQQVALDVKVLDDLEGRHLQPLVVLALGGRRHAARLAGPVLALVDRRRQPAHQLALVEERHHHRLVGVVDAAVARVVVNEAVAVPDADGRVGDPVLHDEADRVEAAGRERDDAVRGDHRKVPLGGVDARHEVAPLRARCGAHLVHHRERLGERRVDQAAHVVHLVRVDALGEGGLLHRRSRRHAVEPHDLRIRPEKQRVVGEKLVSQRLFFGGGGFVHGVSVGDCCADLRMNQTPPWATA